MNCAAQLPRSIIRQQIHHFERIFIRSRSFLAPTIAESIPKIFAEIPGPRGLPFIGTLLSASRLGIFNRLHEFLEIRYQQYGPFYREKIGNLNAVFLFDPDDVAYVCRNEGKYPTRFTPDPWILYAEDKDIKMGLIPLKGEAWHHSRSILNKPLMRLKTIENYVDPFNQVVIDLMDRWKNIQSSDSILPNLEEELFNWSIESIGTILFDQRLGCINDERPQDIQEMVRSLQIWMKSLITLSLFPARVAKILQLPIWVKFEKSFDTLINIGRKYVLQKLGENEAGEKDSFLSYLLNMDNLSSEEVTRMITDMFIAAADSTPVSIQWAMYELGRHPEYQEAIRKEISELIPSNEPIQYKHLQHMTFLKAALKESQRLNPTMPFLTRVLDEDIIIRGHEVPAGTLIMMGTMSMSRDSKNFSDPMLFKPERWLRHELNQGISTFASQPFGFGPRACIGRRLADVEMQLFFIHLFNNFDIELLNSTPMKSYCRTALIPAEPLKFKLLERRK